MNYLFKSLAVAIAVAAFPARLALADVRIDPPHAAAHGENPHAVPAHGEAPSAHGAEPHASGEHGASEHAGGEDHGPAAINWTDFGDKKQPPYMALVINFAVLLGIYVYFGKKPVADGLQKRREDIAKDIENAARMMKEAEARAEKYQSNLANLDKDLETTKKGLEEAGRIDRDRLIEEAKEKAARMKRDAAFLADQESKQAQIDLTREAVTNSFGHAESLLSARTTDDDHDRLCLEFLTELGKKPAARTEASR
jgi:F-type H+-transporting ATPase subunit b